MTRLSKIQHKIPIPDGVTATVDPASNHTKLKGPKGELSRPFRSLSVKVRLEGKHIIVEKALPRREDMAMAGTYAAHIKNMIKGVTKGWTYRMKAVNNHFPIKMSVQGTTFLVENFLGERAARKADIVPGAKVTVKGAEVTIEGTDLASVSQTAANIETCTKIRYKDIRVFQDGVYITNKGE